MAKQPSTASKAKAKPVKAIATVRKPLPAGVKAPASVGVEATKNASKKRAANPKVVRTEKVLVRSSVKTFISPKSEPPASKPTRGQQTQSTRTQSWLGPSDENIVRVRKAGEVVAERFRKQIANGSLAIGHQLPSEEELTATFGIARTTLREALRVLESQGLLEIKRGRGGGGIITTPRLENLSQSLALVLQLQRTTLGDLDDARMLIEPPLAGRLAAAHSDEDLEALTAIVENAHRCAETDDKNGFGKAAAALHEAIIERGGNNTMAVIGALLHDLMDRHYHSAAEISDHEQMSRAVRSYRKLIELIEAGDSVAASAHWHRQLVYLQQRRAAIQMLDLF